MPAQGDPLEALLRAVQGFKSSTRTTAPPVRHIRVRGQRYVSVMERRGSVSINTLTTLAAQGHLVQRLDDGTQGPVKVRFMKVAHFDEASPTAVMGRLRAFYELEEA